MERDRNDGRPALLVDRTSSPQPAGRFPHPGLDHAERDVLFEPW